MAKVFFLLLIFLSLQVHAQEKMETDRPSETENPSIVPKKWMQAEIGISKENTGDNYILVLPVALLRYGISKKIELRLESALLREYEQLVPDPRTKTFTEPVVIGTKISLFEERSIRPKTALLAQATIPLKAKAQPQTTNATTAILLLMQNSVTKSFQVNYNLGVEYDDEASAASWQYSFESDLEITKKLEIFAEIFGSAQKNEKPEHSFDAGIEFLATSNLKFDLAAGWGLSDNVPDHFITLGFSFRLGR
jgi:hypothetical protein